MYNFSLPFFAKTRFFIPSSFAPSHVCIVTPERPSLCGALSWLDCRAAATIDPKGANFPIEKGEVLDPVKGEFSGVNKVVEEYSHGVNQRFYLYSMFDFPHTSCGCFECIAFYIPEVDGIGFVDRNFPAPAVNGVKFSTMAAQSGGGVQTVGFLGFGIQWMFSKKFFSADGGWSRIVWCPSYLKERAKEYIPPEIYDAIATEKDVNTIDELKEFLKKKNHPVVKRWEEEVKEEKEEEKEAEEVEAAQQVPTVLPAGTPTFATSSMVFPAGGFTIILQNVRIYAEKLIIKKMSDKVKDEKGKQKTKG
ncbi:MAG: CO dehydrogenase/CO-methylating acetyl-CoA synthase complex subunit beta [Candidatus Altarchaeaceae archaeon]